MGYWLFYLYSFSYAEETCTFIDFTFFILNLEMNIRIFLNFNVEGYRLSIMYAKILELLNALIMHIILSIMLPFISKQYQFFSSWFLLHFHSKISRKVFPQQFIFTIKSLIVLHTYIYWIHTDAMITDASKNKGRRKENAWRLLFKYIYLSLYCKGSKGLFKGLHVRGCWRPNINFIFWPHCYDRHVVSFLFS